MSTWDCEGVTQPYAYTTERSHDDIRYFRVSRSHGRLVYVFNPGPGPTGFCPGSEELSWSKSATCGWIAGRRGHFLYASHPEPLGNRGVADQGFRSGTEYHQSGYGRLCRRRVG